MNRRSSSNKAPQMAGYSPQANMLGLSRSQGFRDVSWIEADRN
jgi:hypothetical protein